VLETAGFNLSGKSKSDTDSSVDTAFGTAFIRSRRVDAAALEEYRKTLQEFDNSLASFLDDNQINAITETLTNWSSQIEGESLTIEQLLNSRFTAILSTFNSDIQAFVNEASSLEDKASRLQVGVKAENLFASQPDLFGQRTVNQF